MQQVQAMHPHDTKFWKKSSGVGGYAPAGLAKDRSGAKDPCVRAIWVFFLSDLATPASFPADNGPGMKILGAFVWHVS